MDKLSQKSQTLPLLSLRDLVVFPKMMLPLFVGREKSMQALQEAMRTKSDIILATQKSAKNDHPQPSDIYQIGTVGVIIQHLHLADGTIKVMVEGKYRVKIENFENVDKYFLAKARPIIDYVKDETQAKAFMRMVCQAFETFVKLNKQMAPETVSRADAIKEYGALADYVASQLNLKMEDKQKLLEITDAGERLKQVLQFLTKEIEVTKAEKKIRTRVKEQMERSQREYYLNEQLQAIQKELGGKDEYHNELKEFEEKASKKKWNKEASEKVDKEIKKLKMMSAMSAEATVVRNYIDWMLDLPWNDYIKEKKDIQLAEEILNEDHWGLSKVKERILEHLAVRTLSEHEAAPIICFVGPPGVGKTSLARSIARSIGRPFSRISLGGVQDEAEIRGHRRTYVGAMPGKLIQAMRKVNHGNPLILLDEIDKISTQFRGDPSAALLEVLDPEQNCTFQDHYLEVDYNLSSCFFITTANSIDPIPSPLLDRMEVIGIEGYMESEKLNIAKRHLVEKQIHKHGLKPYNVSMSDSALLEIIRFFTREAGVRNLERKIATCFRKLAKEIVSTHLVKKLKPKKSTKTSKKKISYSLTQKSIRKYLGERRVRFGKLEKSNEIGLTNGLAWTPTGGDLLVVESSVIPGKGKLILTGQMGDVMQESCQAALSYVRSRGPLFNIPKNFFEQHDFHIHVPEGAVPKDGPSAGITITSSIVSSVMKIPVKRDVAMTGEVTLRGRVLPIGGLKEKILAAYREGIKMIVIPKENERDLKDEEKGIPKEILDRLEIITVDHVDQVLVMALGIENAEDLFKNRSLKSLGLKARYKGHESFHSH